MMPSTCPGSSQGVQNYYLPPLSDTRGNAHSHQRRLKLEQESLNNWLQSSATLNHGLRTPPRELANMMSGNPLLARDSGGILYNSVPAVKSTAPYSTSLGTIATAQYYSKAPPSNDSRASTVRPENPTFQRDNGARGQQTGNSSTDSNSIATYLQIPSTINDSKGSLAEFAAQVRRLLAKASIYD